MFKLQTYKVSANKDLPKAYPHGVGFKRLGFKSFLFFSILLLHFPHTSSNIPILFSIHIQSFHTTSKHINIPYFTILPKNSRLPHYYIPNTQK